MTRHNLAIEGLRKTGGQKPPHQVTNTRRTESPEKELALLKHTLKSRAVSIRIENDLYERQSS